MERLSFNILKITLICDQNYGKLLRSEPDKLNFLTCIRAFWPVAMEGRPPRALVLRGANDDAKIKNESSYGPDCKVFKHGTVNVRNPNKFGFQRFDICPIPRHPKMSKIWTKLDLFSKKNSKWSNLLPKMLQNFVPFLALSRFRMFSVLKHGTGH